MIPSSDTCLFLCNVVLVSHIFDNFHDLKLQPLFRKIAAALPGMETLSSTKQEDMVDINLKPTANSSHQEQQGGCWC